MKRKFSGLLILVLLGLSILNTTYVQAQKIEGVQRLRWIDQLKRPATGYRDYILLENQKKPADAGILMDFSGDDAEDGEKVLVIVNESLAGEITQELQTFCLDLSNEGYKPVAETWSGGAAADLRNHIIAVYGVGNLDGVILVGELPVAWWEDNYWAAEELPVDYYFMEMNGTWSDSDKDGLLDGLSGDVGPEIWVGRLYASRLTWGGKPELMRKYFAKNHAYRTGGLSVAHRGLSFVDDDWAYWGNCYLNYAYSNITTITSYNQTTAFNYKDYLADGYEWVHLCAHSCPWSHTFMINGGYGGGGSVLNCEINAMSPPALFYNLFNCSGTRYVETDNIGCWYVLSDNYGLVAIGSAKIGSMLNFGDFYYPLGQGKSIGNSYQEWFETQAANGLDAEERAWYMGLNILGDPTLTIFMGDEGEGGLPPRAIPYPVTPVEEWQVSRVSASGFSDCRPVVTPDFQGGAWLFWESGRNTRLDIFASHYNGSSWSTPSAVNVFEYWDAHPAACTDSLGRPWVAWQSFWRNSARARYEIFSSYWNGSSWTAPAQVSPAATMDAVEPALATDANGKVYCVWKGFKNLHTDIFASYWNGSAWTGNKQITSGLTGENLDPAVAALGGSGGVLACWASNAAGDWDITYSINAGSGWSTPTKVAETEGYDTNPCAVLGFDGNVWVSWQNWSDSGADILVSKFDGLSFSVPEAISRSSFDEISPSLATGINEVWCSWMERSQAGWLIKASSNTGSGWSQPEVVAGDYEHCYDPSIAVFEGSPGVAFASDPDGYWNIYWGVKSRFIPELEQGDEKN